MSAAYAFWNNKGGVGKSFLCFVAASEYAHRYPESDVYVIDLCPQANVSEILLGGHDTSPAALHKLMSKEPRATVAGYIEARLNSPFRMIDDVTSYLTHPSDTNKYIPENLILVCGDSLLEVISEPIRQTSQLSIPLDSWKQVLGWIKDLVNSLRERSNQRDSIFILDCNPSFAIYTQLALVAAEYIVVPFTADDSSRRAIENVVALLYGIGDSHIAAYARISFSKRALEEGISLPKLHTFISNRVTQYEGKASKAFEAISETIKITMDNLHSKHRNIFAIPKIKPSESFIEIPDYHSACIIASTKGIPLHTLQPGPQILQGKRVQVNRGRLDKYRKALQSFVNNI